MLAHLQKSEIVGQGSRLDTSTNAPVAIAPPPDDRFRVMFCGTHPIGQSNGYSRVVHHIAKNLGVKKDVRLTIYGFQKYNQTAGIEQRNDIPADVILHDALASENPKRNGFGELEIGDFLKKNPQDMVIIFNDPIIVNALATNIHKVLSEEERKRLILVTYFDQVYEFQKRTHIEMINRYFDAVIAFTPHWRKIIRMLGLDPKIPCYVFPHGFDPRQYFPIPKHIARFYFNLPEDAFIILQLNRNQPRKRIDHTMMAFANVVERYYKLIEAEKAKPEAQRKKIRPIKLMLGTQVHGFWDLIEIFEHELRLRGIPIEFGKECVTAVAKPQQLSDRDVNILSNACDLGINNASGEGWSLCPSDHLGIGKPQVVANVGGIKEFADPSFCAVIQPKMRIYLDKTTDGIGGIAELTHPDDFADAIWKYYTNPKLYEQHSQKARKHMLTNFRWETVVNHFHRVIFHMKGNIQPRTDFYTSAK